MVLGLLAVVAARGTSSDLIRVPLLIVDSRGLAVSDISGESLQVYANGRLLATYFLKRCTPLSSQPARRTVFLIFDTLSTTHLWLSKAKNIAEQIILSSSPGIDYLLLSLEPGSGLRYLLGPSADREEMIRTLRKKIVARQPGTTLDSLPHRIDRDDGLMVGDPRTPRPQMGEMRTERDPLSAPQTHLDEQKKGDLFLSSLRTLNAALSGFSDSVKTVYFFSGGIASRTKYQDRSTINPNLYGEVQTIDSLFLNCLSRVSEVFKASGAVVFVVNPVGTQISQGGVGSGEQQLRLLAENGGGRYLEGETEAIVRQIAALEDSFYEIILSPPELAGGPVDIEVKSGNPDLKLYYGRRAFLSRGFEELGPEEKMRLALDAAEGGDASKMTFNPQAAEQVAKSEGKDRIEYRLKLPDTFLGLPLELFRVWLGKGSGGALVDLEHLGPASAELSISVEKKKGYRIRVVIIEPRTVAALVVS